MKTKHILIILGLIIAGVVVYNLPYFSEKRAYNKVEEEKTLDACDVYEKEWPKGTHIDDVLYLRISLVEGVERVTEISNYLLKCPDGKHAAEAKAESDKLWNEEIAKYEARDKKGVKDEAKDFMDAMLRYMKQNRINTIFVDYNSTLKLKEYTEYSKNIRDMLESVNDETLSLEEGMITFSSNFDQANMDELNKILVDGVQKSMDKIFTPGFIRVVSSNDENGVVNDKMPKLHFECKITSQEETVGAYTIPEIWVYTEQQRSLSTPFGKGSVKGFLIGISILFDASFTLPNNLSTYEFSDKGEPKNDISNIENIQDGYRKMSAICFQRFSNKIAKNMGLDDAYTDDDIKGVDNTQYKAPPLTL